MPVPGVAPVQARSVVVTAAASRIPAPSREAGVTTHILVPPRLPDAPETRTPAAAPVPAAMVMPEAASPPPLRPGPTAGHPPAAPLPPSRSPPPPPTLPHPPP